MKPKLKLRVRTNYLSSVFSGTGTNIRKDGLAAYVDIDFSNLVQIDTYDPLQQLILVESLDGIYSKMTLATLINKTQARRVITAAGNVNVTPTDGLIVLAKTVAEDTDFLMPADTSKIGAVKIVDFNGVGASKVLRIVPNGSETISGQSTWQLSGAYSSIVLSPTGAGLGYAV